MERSAWTDERLDDKMNAIDNAFDRSFAEMRTSRAELREEMAELRAEMRAGFAEMRVGFAEVRTEILALHRQLTLVTVAFGVGMLGIVGALAAAFAAAQF